MNASGLAPGTYSSTITLTRPRRRPRQSADRARHAHGDRGHDVGNSDLALVQADIGAAAPAEPKRSRSPPAARISPSTPIVSMDNGSGWLTATPTNATATSATPATVTVAVNGSNLAPGTYTGKVTILATPPFTNGSPANVTVTLVVTPGTISATPATLSFAQVQGGPAPPSQTLSIAGTPGVLAYTVATSTANNSGNWLTVDATTGNTPGTVKVSVNSGIALRLATTLAR